MDEIFRNAYLVKQLSEEKMYETWDALQKLEAGIEALTEQHRSTKVNISYVTEEDDEISEDDITIIIYVKRKVTAEEFNNWFYRKQK